MKKQSQAAILKVKNSISSAVLEKIVADLLEGQPVIFPTETVYGLGTSVFSPRGIQTIYQLKGRTWRKPLAVLVPELSAAQPLIETIPKEAWRLAEAFMPGPLTLVFPASELGRMIMGGLTTIGVRIPDHPVALQLLRAAGVPLATTSVNPSGEEPAVTGTEAKRLFGDQVAWCLDGGRCRIKQPSSVVDLSHYPFTIRRAGAVPKKELERILFAP